MALTPVSNAQASDSLLSHRTSRLSDKRWRKHAAIGGEGGRLPVHFVLKRRNSCLRLPQFGDCSVTLARDLSQRRLCLSKLTLGLGSISFQRQSQTQRSCYRWFWGTGLLSHPQPRKKAAQVLVDVLHFFYASFRPCALPSWGCA
jgi:hypothetical protein